MSEKHITGFALVELLVIATIVALIAGIAIIALTSTTSTNHASRKLCETEAQKFQDAVKKFHDEDPKHTWPGGDNKDHVFGLVLHDLIAKGLISSSGPDYVDGGLLDVRTNERGWLYNFEDHTTATAGCH